MSRNSKANDAPVTSYLIDDTVFVLEGLAALHSGSLRSNQPLRMMDFSMNKR